jgi:ABC-2 type transport system ATP-binding protein
MADIEQVCERVVIINTGKIVFDGNIRELGRMDGFKKQIKVVFNGPWAMDWVSKLGRIIEKNEQEILLEVEPGEAALVASTLFAHFPIKDIGIMSPRLETIIESIYLRKESVRC